MTRTRIRTLKPELWADENVGELRRDARLLFIGLVTMADDEGRLRATPSLILGHVFPYDDDVTPAKLTKWLAEIERTGVILRYESGGKPYIAFRHWRRHQRPNRASCSTMPPPPDPVVVRQNAVPAQGTRTEDSVNEHGARTEGVEPHAQAQGVGGFRSDPFLPLEDDARAPLSERVDGVEAILGQCPSLFISRVAIENAVAAYPTADPVLAARTVVTWASDPAFRSTNGAKLLGDALAKQPTKQKTADKDERTRRRLASVAELTGDHRG